MQARAGLDVLVVSARDDDTRRTSREARGDFGSDE